MCVLSSFQASYTYVQSGGLISTLAMISSDRVVRRHEREGMLQRQMSRQQATSTLNNASRRSQTGNAVASFSPAPARPEIPDSISSISFQRRNSAISSGSSSNSGRTSLSTYFPSSGIAVGGDPTIMPSPGSINFPTSGLSSPVSASHEQRVFVPS